jgi:hypothetical protein
MCTTAGVDHQSLTPSAEDQHPAAPGKAGARKYGGPVHDADGQARHPSRRRAPRSAIDRGWAPIAPKPWRSGPGGLIGRVARAGTFTAFNFALAFGAHVLAGGTVSPLAGWLTLAAMGCLGWVVSSRERSGRFIGSLAVLTQVAAHLGFATPPLIAAIRAGGGHLSTPELQALLFCHHGASPLTADQVHQAAQGLDLGRSGAGPSVHVGHLLVAAAPMFAAHVAAAVVIAWWLRIGECAVWTAARRAVVVLSDIVRGPRPVVVSRPVRAIFDVVLHAAARLASSVSRRGPPLPPVFVLSIA